MGQKETGFVIASLYCESNRSACARVFYARARVTDQSVSHTIGADRMSNRDFTVQAKEGRRRLPNFCALSVRLFR